MAESCWWVSNIKISILLRDGWFYNTRVSLKWDKFHICTPQLSFNPFKFSKEIASVEPTALHLHFHYIQVAIRSEGLRYDGSILYKARWKIYRDKTHQKRETPINELRLQFSWRKFCKRHCKNSNPIKKSQRSDDYSSRRDLILCCISSTWIIWMIKWNKIILPSIEISESLPTSLAT